MRTLYADFTGRALSEIFDKLPEKIREKDHSWERLNISIGLMENYCHTYMDMKLEEGYQYDIPFDNLMLPYIPIADILRKDGLITEDVKVGFAHPVGYRGLCHMSKELLKNRPGVAPFIKMQFTNDRTEKKNGMRIRSIKAGKRFFATVLIPPDLEEEFEKSHRPQKNRHYS